MARDRSMLERGEIHLGQNLLRAVQPGDQRFASYPLEAIDLLAACHPSLLPDPGKTIEIAASHHIPCCCSMAASYFAATSMPPAASPDCSRASSLKAEAAHPAGDG